MTDGRAFTDPAALIDAWFDAEPGADVCVRTGTVDGGSGAAVIVSIGTHHYAASPVVARFLADAAERAMHLYPQDPTGKDLPDLILTLRAAADSLTQGDTNG